jgi:hypothetical protein
MVGSLVVVLPSRHEGGTFVVQHHQDKKFFHGATPRPKDLSLLAFYADCHHEVKPVTAGYRVTLTHHLLYRGAAAGQPADIPLEAIESLEAGVKEHFSTRAVDPEVRSAPARPDRLIYLLDHEYTQQSLRWDHLKNADRLRVGALRQVAERLDCEVYLALADVHEIWTCEEDEWDSEYGWRYDDDDADDDEAGEARDADDHQLIDLIDRDIELRHWVGPDGRIVPGISSIPASSEVCFTRASDEKNPFKSEHEGYMGNYGNTVERWYHRAALVMWPRERNFVIRAKVSPSWAVREIASRIKAGKTDEARGMARELLPFWGGVASQETSATFSLELLKVAASFDDAKMALGLLSPLGPDRLSPRTTPAFVELVERHGLSWAQQLFSSWTGRGRYGAPPWRSLLPRLGEALCAGREHGKALAEWLLSREVASFKQRQKGALKLPAVLREEGADKDLADLLSLLETAAVIRAPAIQDDLIAFITAPETALPLMAAGALLQKSQQGRTLAAVKALGLQALARRVETLLDRALAAEPRSPDDWSIEPPSGCSCALCKELSTFLRDRDRTEFAWPLPEKQRQHIHQVIDDNRLPLAHTTSRHGRPYTLLLTKQKALFEREAALRARQEKLLAWLRKQKGAFDHAPSPASAPGQAP